MKPFYKIEQYEPKEKKYPVGMIGDHILDEEHGHFPIDIYYPAISGNPVHPDKGGAPYPAVVFTHGFGASKEYYSWIGNLLAEQGFVISIFTTPNPLSINIWQYVAGIKLSIDYLEEKCKVKEDILHELIKKESIGVMGHSFGAGAAIIAGSEDKRIKAVVALAPPGRIQQERLGWFGDLIAKSGIIQNPIDIIEDSANILSSPIQIHVGSCDRLCPPTDIYRYYEAAKGPKDFQIIEGGNHVQFSDYDLTFRGLLDNGSQITLEQQQEISLKNFLTWFNKYL